MQHSVDTRLGRRGLVASMGAVLAWLGLPGAVRALDPTSREGTQDALHRGKGPHETSQPPPADATVSQPPLAALFRGLEGTRLERWHVQQVKATAFGSVAFVLDGAGHTFQVDVLRRDGAAQGVAWTAALDLFLVSDATSDAGDRATPEQQGLGAMALARVLHARAESGTAVPALASYAERAARHPRGTFRVV